MSFATSLFSSPLAQTLQGSTSSSAVTAKAATGTTSSSSSSASTSSADAIGSTFLSLLVQELQNQDPTAPMDSTAMVGQMISLNQLNQLTNINQVLSKSYGATSAGSAPAARVQTTAPEALHLLSNTAMVTRPAVAPSVTLPAL